MSGIPFADGFWCPVTRQPLYGAWRDGWTSIAYFGLRYYLYAARRYVYHTGDDLALRMSTNGNLWLNQGKPLYAIAHGQVVWLSNESGVGNVLIIKHIGYGKPDTYSRHVHSQNVRVGVGQIVYKGEQIAEIGNGDGAVSAHAHLDIVQSDLFMRDPLHGVVGSLAELRRLYKNPLQFLTANRAWALPPARPAPPPAPPPNGVLLRVTAVQLNVRSRPSTGGAVLRVLARGEVVSGAAVGNGWYALESGGYVAGGYVVRV